MHRKHDGNQVSKQHITKNGYKTTRTHSYIIRTYYFHLGYIATKQTV